MFRSPPPRLSEARVLISNDDGINAPGIKALEKVMREVAREVWVVAPETEQSGSAHSLTLRLPLRLRKLSDFRYSVDGTPTDSVLLACNVVMKDNPPDLVLSGINPGGNLGEDVHYSGTVAAALEGTLLGYRAIALSQVCTDRKPVKWSTAETHVVEVVERLLGMDWPRDMMINVNFPDVPAASVKGVRPTVQGRRKLGGELVPGEDPRGNPFYWIGAQRTEDRYREGSDLKTVCDGAIAVTPLSLDMTHQDTVGALQRVFG